MTKTFRALGIAASVLLGTAVAASAAVTADSQGNTAPTGGSVQVQPGAPLAPTYQGSTTVTPGYQTSQSNAATMAPHVDRGNAEGAGGGAGAGGGGNGGGGAGH